MVTRRSCCKRADAILGGANGYGNGWGDPRLRAAVSARFDRHHGLRYNPETEVTITAGASAALNAIMLAFVNPGERVIVFEPFFENFAPQVTLAGGIPSSSLSRRRTGPSTRRHWPARSPRRQSCCC